MKLALPRYIASWLARQTCNEEEQDRADVEYIQMAKKDARFRPLREVLAEIEAEKRELPRPVRQPS